MAGIMRLSVTKFIMGDPTTTLLALTAALFLAGIVFSKK
jgi:hypothetical protein